MFIDCLLRFGDGDGFLDGQYGYLDYILNLSPGRFGFDQYHEGGFDWQTGIFVPKLIQWLLSLGGP